MPAPRLPRGFRILIAAQFASALADNALLIVAIALLARQGLPGWWAPLLKFGFMLSYVLLAPFVGPLADAWPKARVMAAMNLVKMGGVVLLLAGLHPVAALTVVGLGAAAYAPAKYGLVTELVEPENLVAANGWLEVSVVCAALLGAVLGGALVSPQWAAAASRLALDLPAGALAGSLFALLSLYALSSALNVRVPDSGAHYAASAIDPRALLADFRAANRTLWRDRDGGLSLAATTIFWGVGATLQFAVLVWSEAALGLSLHQAAYLQAAVALGVVSGAALAGRLVALRHAKRTLALGVALGLMLPVVAQLDRVVSAALGLALAGALGGAMVVPLNALLQHRGHVLLTAGRSIAVQGFNENLSVLVMLALYSLARAGELPIRATLATLGLATAAAVLLLMGRERRRVRRGPQVG